MAAAGRLVKQLYKDFGQPLVDEVMSYLGRDADPEIVAKAVAQAAQQREGLRAENKLGFQDMVLKGRMRTDAHNDRANVDLVVKGEKPATNINLDFDDLDDDTDAWLESLPPNLVIINHPKQFGEVIVAKTKEDAMRVANADTNYAFGKAYGYSDNDIAYFYDKRFGPYAYDNWIADRQDWLSQNPSKPTKKAKGGFAVKKGR